MGQAKTLAEIRSDACDQALIIITAAGFPVVGLSLLQAMAHGWKPISALYVSVLAVLLFTTLRRRHITLNVKAGVVTAALIAVAIGGILSFGPRTGVVMYFVSATIFAGCMFDRRVGFALTAATALVVLAIFEGVRTGFLPGPINQKVYLADIAGWFTLAAAYFVATVIPLVATSAIMHALDLERQRADTALDVRSEFLARMSHELRTPMTGIIGMADLLGITNLDNPQRDMVNRLMRSARHLLALLNDLLDLAKIDSGRMQIEIAPFAVSRVVAEACDLFAMAAAKKGLAFSVHMPAELHDHLLGDGYRLRQILNYLIDNAVKFTDRGQVKVEVAQERKGAGTIMLIVSVIDTGIGIPAPQRAELFQPFVQVDVSMSRRYGGSGLGLAIGRNLAETMGGSIAVSSAPSAGSRFTLTLPFKIDPAAVTAVNGPVADAGGTWWPSSVPALGPRG